MNVKRYWFSIALPVFVAISIGTYYVGAAMRDLPDYRIEKVTGDAKEAANLVIDGETKRPQIRYQLEVGADGSSYDIKKSLIDQMKEVYYTESNPDLAHLKKEHRGFTRGQNNYSGFYADDIKLVYAAANRGSGDSSDGRSSYSISIRTQDLKSGKKKDFQAILPGKPKYYSLYVYDVQAKGSQLKLMAQLSKGSAEDYRRGILKSEIHLYTVDLDKEGIIDDQTIASDKKLEGGRAEHFQIIGVNADFVSPSDYVMIGRSLVQTKQLSDGNTEEIPIESNYLAYRYSADTLIPVPIKASVDGMDYPMLSERQVITFSMKDNQLHVDRYDIAKQQQGSSFDILLSLKLSQLSSIQKIVYGDRLYVFNRVNAEYEVIVADTTRGKVVYQGKIAVDGNAEQQAARMKELQLYGFYLTF
ncbi:hypothetical protein [Paenibacillus glycinis]|uniref:Uncharacterized protein n=1 Tax=Paenibacillus glycinis TaxID=2697035 RepID=A0ABW9XJI2_9BACL|nr:hypothetical protein [Paenibacillus glycinis]NBD22785.1 hypothetical protein [Paenibacillus glycinis]